MKRHGFQVRLGSFISAPHHRVLQPRKFAEKFVWTRQQDIAGKRRHLPRKWYYDNSCRNAYSVSMHLLMLRESRIHA